MVVSHGYGNSIDVIYIYKSSLISVNLHAQSTFQPEEQKPIDLNASGTVRSIIESLRLFIRQRDEDVTGDAPMPSTIGEPTLDRGRSRAKKTNNATAYFD